MYPLNSLNRSPLFASKAFTLLRSTLLKIVFNTSVCSPWVIFPRIPLRSWKVSFNGRIFPFASKTLSPNSCIFFFAVSVGAVRLKITFRNAVPPSAPFVPLSANIPNTVFASVTPPAKLLAVPPTLSSASPNCCTLVLLFCEVFAILSTKLSVVPALSPSALMLSVTMSEAVAKSIPPAAARFKTVGNVSTALSASYPASAI